MKLKQKSIIERFLIPNPAWQEGYRTFLKNFGDPIGWIYLLEESGAHRLVRLDRRGHCTFYGASKSNQMNCAAFLEKYFSQWAEKDAAELDKLPTFYKCAYGRNGAIFALRHLGRLKGFLILCAFTKPEQQVRPVLPLFNHFLQSQLELAYKAYELNNFYETVHPRALALSTMHSVHRVISSSLHLGELLPRIGRLCAQVLRAKNCSILLMDPDGKHLLPYFSFGESKVAIRKHRIPLGRGLEGRLAESGESHFDRHCIAVPFIEDDVVGIVTLRDKIDNQSFTPTDLEILKSLSEQAVVAIKNAQLFEETEKLTVGSIQTISDLLELHYGGERSQIPVFGKIVLEVAKDLKLNGQEIMHLERAILLLDTGQLAFPEKLWNKKGKLTKKEFEQIKRIPLRGASLLKSISSLKPVLPIILHHRERYDGKGYPRGLRGEEIPIGARIVAVLDSFLAMISQRVYRKRLSVEEALEEIRENSGSQFDPKVVESFLKVIRRKDLYDLVSQAATELPRSVRQTQLTGGNDGPRQKRVTHTN
ncbi:MAG: GAF domain-containing protein [Candidatus Omnitrophica bacterium]|nr:GAF domain-containing protein [Candidatus Omnitrophota bacterium]